MYVFEPNVASSHQYIACIFGSIKANVILTTKLENRVIELSMLQHAFLLFCMLPPFYAVFKTRGS
jgi:hypothetical protein